MEIQVVPREVLVLAQHKKNMKKFILTLLMLLGLVLLPFGVGFTYQITQFSAGEEQYVLSEPTIDWLGFMGKTIPIFVEPDFAFMMFEGSNPDQSQWVNILMLSERLERKIYILIVAIHEGVTSGDSKKMKTTTLYHKSIIEGQKADFKLIKMNPEPDMKKFIDDRMLRSKIKNRSVRGNYAGKNFQKGWRLQCPYSPWNKK